MKIPRFTKKDFKENPQLEVALIISNIIQLDRLFILTHDERYYKEEYKTIKRLAKLF